MVIMRLIPIYIGLLAIGGWLILTIQIWWLFSYGGKAWINAIAFGELGWDLFFINGGFICSIILFILDIYYIKRKEVKNGSTEKKDSV